MRILLPFAILAGAVLFGGCTATVVEERHGGSPHYSYGYGSGSSYYRTRQPGYYDGSSYRTGTTYSSGYSRARAPYPYRPSYHQSTTVERTHVSNTYVNRTNVARKSAPVPNRAATPPVTKKQSHDKKGKKKHDDHPGT